VSLPSPGTQKKLSSPVPRNATSLPRPPATTSLPPSAEITSASSEGRGCPPVADTVGDTKPGVMVSAASVPVNTDMLKSLI
jgi:hypothetical protein